MNKSSIFTSLEPASSNLIFEFHLSVGAFVRHISKKPNWAGLHRRGSRRVIREVRVSSIHHTLRAATSAMEPHLLRFL
ncbi:MAG: hypothetical protein ACK40T_08835 [Akkermansiaceae bacterium]